MIRSQSCYTKLHYTELNSAYYTELHYNELNLMCTFPSRQAYHDPIAVFDHPKVEDCLINEFINIKIT